MTTTIETNDLDLIKKDLLKMNLPLVDKQLDSILDGWSHVIKETNRNGDPVITQVVVQKEKTLCEDCKKEILKVTRKTI